MKPLWMMYAMSPIFWNRFLKHKSVKDEDKYLMAQYYERQEFFK
jgi:hypothetical protein